MENVLEHVFTAFSVHLIPVLAKICQSFCLEECHQECSLGSGGQLNRPQSIQVSKGRIYVVDTGNHRIQIYSTKNMAIIQSIGCKEGQFRTPWAIAIYKTTIYVSDFGNSRIQLFTFEGNYLGSIGSQGSEFGQFDSPSGIRIYKNHLYVADQFNHRIQIFNVNGALVRSFGSFGIHTGQLHYPYDVLVRKRQIYVSDTYDSRLHIFTSKGDILRTIFPTHQFCTIDVIGIYQMNIFKGRIYAAASIDYEHLQIWAFDGSWFHPIYSKQCTMKTDYSFRHYHGISLYKNRIYIGDSDNHSVCILYQSV